MTFNLEAKKHTLRLFHHNVAIVSSGKGENAVGATVTWFTQSSFEPPLVTMAVASLHFKAVCHPLASEKRPVVRR